MHVDLVLFYEIESPGGGNYISKQKVVLCKLKPLQRLLFL